MAKRIIRRDNGDWLIVDGDDNTVAGPFATNAEAWRALDRMTGEIVNKAESTAAWVWERQVHGE